MALRIYRLLEEPESSFCLAELLDTQGWGIGDEWQSVVQFLWNLGPIGKKAIKDLIEGADDHLFFADVALLEALGQTQDAQAIPLLLNSLVRFYERADGKADRHTFRHAMLMELTIFKALERLGYEHLELWRAAPSWASEEGDCSPIGDVLALEMTKALFEDRLEDAQQLKEFIEGYRELTEAAELTMFDGDEIAAQRLASAISGGQLPKALEMLRSAFALEQLNPRTFLELNPKQQDTVLRRVVYAAVSQEMLNRLADIYELIVDEQVKSTVEVIQRRIAEALYRQLANEQFRLIEQLGSSNWTERWKAVYALGDWGNGVASDALENLLSCESDPVVRRIAQVSIRKIKYRYSQC